MQRNDYFKLLTRALKPRKQTPSPTCPFIILTMSKISTNPVGDRISRTTITPLFTSEGLLSVYVGDRFSPFAFPQERRSAAVNGPLKGVSESVNTYFAKMKRNR